MRGHETVRTVMTVNPVTVRQNTRFKDIARLMTEHGISAVPVVDELGAPVGVVSEADLLPKAECQDQDEPGRFAGPQRRHEWDKAQARTAVELMSRRPLAIDADTSLPAAARKLAKSGVRRLLVVDDSGHLVGVVARRDLLRPFARADEEIAADVRSQALVGGLWLQPADVEVEVNVADGVVTLAGTLERRSEAEIAVRLTQALPGVVAVIDRLDYDWDDTQAKLDTSNLLH
jgi:CBS domain-containing protein